MDPRLPAGRHLDLPGRGRTWVREVPGPPGAPTLLLLHGWTANADLNWFSSFRALGDHFRVVAPDHRGHGRGIRTRRGFRMRDAADDAAALLDALGIESAIAVGYSMGGAVAQLLWRRHPERVDGLVLCATSSVFASTDRERRWFAAMGALSLASRATPGVARQAVAGWVLDRRQQSPAVEWVQRELRRNDWTAVLGAGAALGRFDSRPWLGEVDVPTAVVLTRGDRVVSPRRQAAMAAAIPGASVHPVDGDHGVVAVEPGRFVPALTRAAREVAGRAEAAGRPAASSRISTIAT
ncbi:MAG TPA: alpha/beta hydrolase [Acidimicrobiales bacterium]|nr:alpha/beta hydrolase [Acidimicrobiales bacterium]